MDQAREGEKGMKKQNIVDSGMLIPNAHRNARHRKAWRDAVKAIITPDKVCVRCGKHPEKENPLTIHHTTREAYFYENFHLYEKLSPELPFELVCKRCHFAAHKGMVICKKCKERYHPGGYETCFPCSGKRENPWFEPGEIHQMYESEKEGVAE